MSALRIALRSAVLVGVLAAAVLSAGPASAHERREVCPYEVVVGFYDEPAFANQPNGPEISISRGGDPVVEDVELQVEIGFGDETTTLEIEPAFVVGVFGEEGNYNADFFPTRPGTYTFRFFGTIEGQEIDETFTSGPETFSDVNDPNEMAFPATDPNNAELASALAAAESDVSSARTFSYIGMGVGALAVVLALALGLRGRGRA